MDSNFIEYLTPDILGEPSMPNYMNNVATKLESIAQSLIKNAINERGNYHIALETISREQLSKYELNKQLKRKNKKG